MRHLLYILLLLPMFLHAQTLHITTPADTICSGSTVHFKATYGGISVPHFHWYINNAEKGADSFGFTTNTLVNSDTVLCLLTNSAGDTVLTTSNDIVMTIEHMPVVSPITGTDSIVCVGATITFSDAAPGGLWISGDLDATVANGVVTGVSSTGGFTPPVLIYYIVSNSCGSDSAQKTINVQSVPYSGFMLDYPYACVGQSTPINDDFYVDMVYSTYGNVSVSFCGHDNPCIYGVKPGKDYVYRTVTNTCGTSTSGTWITVYDKPVITSIIAPGEICAGDSVKLYDSTDGFYPKWTVSNTNAIINTAGVLRGLDPGQVTIHLSVSNSCGSGSGSTTMNILPPGRISGFDSVCLGGSIIFRDTTKGGTWSSSDPDVATVDQSGLFSGKTEGVTTIRYASGSCSVAKQVKVNPPIESIEGDNKLCTDGRTRLADATAGGSWSSSATLIATVDGTGTVLGKSDGTATITYQVSGCRATSDMLIGPQNLISGSANVCTNTEMTLTGSGDGNWRSGDPAITVNYYTGVVKGLSPGFATVVYSLPTGCTDKMVITVTDCNNKISVFPNPSVNEVTLQVDTASYHSFSFMNSVGQVVLKQSISSTFTTVNLGLVPHGIYLVRFYGPNDNVTVQFWRE